LKASRFINRIARFSPDAQIRFHTQGEQDLEVLSIYVEGGHNNPERAQPITQYIEIDLGHDDEVEHRKQSERFQALMLQARELGIDEEEHALSFIIDSLISYQETCNEKMRDRRNARYHDAWSIARERCKVLVGLLTEASPWKKL
jgi:hypothetical protein